MGGDYHKITLHHLRVSREDEPLEFSYNPANQLSDDVLQVIFDYLNEKDFLRCEVVCRRWRNFLQSATPWRRLFHRKLISSGK